MNEHFVDALTSEKILNMIGDYLAEEDKDIATCFSDENEAFYFAGTVVDFFKNIYIEANIEVYRTIKLNINKSINYNNLGNSWSWLKESALEFAKQNLGWENVYMMNGVVNNKSIDWKTTIEIYCQNYALMFCGYSIGDTEMENEFYIPIANTNTIKHLEIKKLC